MPAKPSTGVQPSAEAIEAAHRASTAAMFEFTYRGLEDDHLRCEQSKARAALTVAYKVDTPAIHAAGVAEGREAERREIVEWLREGARDAKDWADAAGSGRLSRLAEAIEAARFPSEGTT